MPGRPRRGPSGTDSERCRPTASSRAGWATGGGVSLEGLLLVVHEASQDGHPRGPRRIKRDAAAKREKDRGPLEAARVEGGHHAVHFDLVDVAGCSGTGGAHRGANLVDRVKVGGSRGRQQRRVDVAREVLDHERHDVAPPGHDGQCQRDEANAVRRDARKAPSSSATFGPAIETNRRRPNVRCGQI